MSVCLHIVALRVDFYYVFCGQLARGLVEHGQINLVRIEKAEIKVVWYPKSGGGVRRTLKRGVLHVCTVPDDRIPVRRDSK